MTKATFQKQTLLLGTVAHAYNSSSQNRVEAEKSLEVQGQFGLQSEGQNNLSHNVFLKSKTQPKYNTENKPILWRSTKIYS